MADPCGRQTQLSDLPMDVLGSIADRIRTFGDCVRFDSVVRLLGDGSSSSSSRQLQKLRNFPWLVVEVNETTKILCFFSGRIIFPSHAQPPTARNPVRCAGSFSGWLFITGVFRTDSTGDGRPYLNIFLLDPCTNQRIRLPRLNFGMRKVVMSDSDGGLLAVANGSTLAFCRLGDEEWSYRDSLNIFTFTDIIFFKGVLYAVDDHRCKITAIEFRKAEDGGIQERILPLKRHPKSRVKDRRYNQFFFVESDGELLLVVKEVELCCRNEADHGNDCVCYGKTIGFCVLMLDFSGPRWVELTTLDNRMLLINWTCSASLDAVKFTRFGFRPNCIYYNNYGCLDEDYGWYEFCLEDNNIVPFGCD